MNVRAPAVVAGVLLLAEVLPVGSRAGFRVVVLGFDGADAGLVETFMAAGELPELEALRSEGCYARLEPTNPPQTPVSWSSFATGFDPGTTEIFDFLKRDPESYLPDFAMNSESRRVFFQGERNAPIAGAAAGAVILVVLLLPFARLRWRRALRFGATVTIAAVAGAMVGVGVARWLPVEMPDVINHRKGQTFWAIADAAGLRAQVIHVPATFPAEPSEHGRMISGLGVPDLRGRVGTPAFYTSDPHFEGGDNEFSLELVRLPARRGRIKTVVVGPYNRAFYDYVIDRQLARTSTAERTRAREQIQDELRRRGVARRIDLPMTLDVTDSTCTIEVSGQTVRLREGEWSDFVELSFPVNWVVDRVSPLLGLVRFKLLKLDPEVELYLSPLNFHPDCHPVAFSWPPDYSEEIRRRFGLFKTIGWPEDTWSLPSGVGDENLFLEDMYFTLAKDREILRGLLGDGRDDLYVQIFYFTDRIGHLFWQFIDEGHPLYEPERAARYAPEVLRAYRAMDEVVGETRALLDEDDVLIVLSDHGFSSFRRGINYNTWLVQHGLMTLKGQGGLGTLEKLFDTGELFGHVDWTRTKAYALGLGSIYLNVLGRESQGIVIPGAEYDDVCRRIREGLEAVVDSASGERPVNRVWTRDEMYVRGFDAELIPDLRAGNNLNYRVSWQTTLGGVSSELIEDNRRAWSGDHCSSDPSLIPGILFCNRALDVREPRMIDMMPTILDLLGLQPPAGLHGRSLAPAP
jgi:predicted AlkP superfamily phosphohydrolase/phosphomutase